MPPRRSGADRRRAAITKTAARYPTAYYGQLARARLGIEAVTLRSPPEPTAEHYRLEVARAFEILYAIEERDIIAIMAADLGDKSADAPGWRRSARSPSATTTRAQRS